jgi:hypothetical protein
MSIYSVGLRTTDTTINHAMVEIYTPSTLAIKVMEIGIAKTSTAAVALGLGRPQAQGVTPVAVAFQPEQNSGDPAAKTNASLSWATSPTVPLVYLRRVLLPGTAGAGVIWTFPRGLHLPASASLIIFNITAGEAMDVWIVIDE